MFTSKLPFEGKNASELAKMHQSKAPISPNELNEAIPENFNEIILKVLSKEPSARYRTADQLGRVLVNMNEASLGNSGNGYDTSENSTIGVGKSEEIDWAAVGLGLLAVLAVGGLLPFSMWIYLV